MNKGKFFISCFTFIIAAGFVLLMGTMAMAAGAEGQAVTAAVEGNNRALFGFAAMGAVGISCITSSYALAKIGSAAMGAMSEKPEIGGRALIFLGMAEGIAIYGLIVAIMLVNKM